MSNTTIQLTNDLRTYLLEVSLRETDIQRRLREETASHPESQMQIAPEQGQFMALLVKLVRAQKTLEVGVFTGYSSLAVALALPPHGQIVACDVNEEYTDTARRYWDEAGVAHKIDLRIGPAVETLDKLIDLGHAATFDFAFIDADKSNYDAYYERTLQLLRPGGLMVIDNTLRGGRVIDENVQDEGTKAVRALNAKLREDNRVDLSLVPIADGLTLALKAGPAPRIHRGR